MDLINKTMKVLKFSICLFTLGVFTACNSTDKKIITYVSSVCSNYSDSCCIDLREALNIDYDKMYLFCEDTPDNVISKIIKQKYDKNKHITDSKYRIILLKNNKIMYEDDFYQHYIEFAPITEERDTINYRNFYYLIHNSPYYSAIKGIKSSGYIFYKLMEISNNTQYRWVSDNEKGYVFEKIIK
jgi:hypothetical protein